MLSTLSHKSRKDGAPSLGMISAESRSEGRGTRPASALIRSSAKPKQGRLPSIHPRPLGLARQLFVRFNEPIRFLDQLICDVPQFSRLLKKVFNFIVFAADVNTGRKAFVIALRVDSVASFIDYTGL